VYEFKSNQIKSNQIKSIIACIHVYSVNFKAFYIASILYFSTIYIKIEFSFFSFIFYLSFYTLFDVIDNEIYLYMMLTTNLLILFCVQIKVRRIKKFQFNIVQMMLKHCMIRKIIMQNFYLHDNISFNSYSWFMKKFNDMLMLIKNEKILLMK